jgi:hypothetical protein
MQKYLQAYKLVCLHSTASNLWMEENLWTEKSLISNVYGEKLLCNRILALVLLYPLRRLRIIFAKLLHDVRAHVREFLLHTNSLDH